jgi:hypothetical protein
MFHLATGGVERSSRPSFFFTFNRRFPMKENEKNEAEKMLKEIGLSIAPDAMHNAAEQAAMEIYTAAQMKGDLHASVTPQQWLRAVRKAFAILQLVASESGLIKEQEICPFETLEAFAAGILHTTNRVHFKLHEEAGDGQAANTPKHEAEKMPGPVIRPNQTHLN